MLNVAYNPLANWLWKDLYVWPQGRLSPSGYLGAMVRILIVYVIFSQALTIAGPAMFGVFNSKSPLDMFEHVLWGQVGAVVLIAFPAWSNFQRRFNDMRPDLRERLKAWSVGFPLILVGLCVLMVVRAAGISTPFDSLDLGKIRFWFAVMLFGAAFVPSGDAVPASKTVTKSAPDLFQSAAQNATGKVPGAPVFGHNLPAIHTGRSKPVPEASFPQVIIRTRPLPQDGRVKLGWFS